MFAFVETSAAICDAIIQVVCTALLHWLFWASTVW